MIVKLLTEHHLEFLSLKGGCRDSSKSTHVKVPRCWKCQALSQVAFFFTDFQNQINDITYMTLVTSTVLVMKNPLNYVRSREVII